jgi:hypothetical protein
MAVSDRDRMVPRAVALAGREEGEARGRRAHPGHGSPACVYADDVASECIDPLSVA